MKKLIPLLLIATCFAGCGHLLNPLTPVNEIETTGQVLTKAAAVGFVTYFSEGAEEKFPDTNERVNHSIEKADEFLAAFYPTKRYSVANLIHSSEAFQYVKRSDLILMIHILRIYLNDDGSFTGIDFLDALLQAQAASGITLDTALEATVNVQ
jgi:hypothetical protein